MKALVMIVEDHHQDGQLMKNWLETYIQDVQVSCLSSPREAKKALEKFEQKNLVRCIVLDMYYETMGSDEESALGQQILDEYPDTPIVLISADKRTRDSMAAMSATDNMPLLQLDKPFSLFPAGDPIAELNVSDFRRDLVEAVKCGLVVGSLKADKARLEKKQQTWRLESSSATLKTAGLFLVCVIAYGTSVAYLAEFIQHILLAVCAVTGVHLLDRALLFRDLQNAFESVSQRLVELSVEVQRSAQECRDRFVLLSAREDAERPGKSGGSESAR